MVINGGKKRERYKRELESWRESGVCFGFTFISRSVTMVFLYYEVSVSIFVQVAALGLRATSLEYPQVTTCKLAVNPYFLSPSLYECEPQIESLVGGTGW